MRKSVVMFLLVLTACGQPVSTPVTPASAPPSATGLAVPPPVSTATLDITSTPMPSVFKFRCATTITDTCACVTNPCGFFRHHCLALHPCHPFYHFRSKCATH